MGNKITDELLSTVRSIVDSGYSDMDIIRALHMANNDVTAAINIIFDTPTPKSKERSDFASSPKISSPEVANSKPNGGDCPASSGDDVVGDVESSAGSEWWLVGCGEVAGLSTCRGRRIKPRDEVDFTFPLKISPSPGKVFGRGRPPAACSEIVRFSTTDSGEIGRIPKEWARCLLPLVRDKKVKIEGHCKSAPDVLSIMDTILLSISVHINSSMFLKQKQTSLKTASNSTEETVVHPLPTLFQLLGLTPFQKAEFTPGDLYTRKRPLDQKDSSGLCASIIHANISKNPSRNEDEVENEECISDAEVDNIVGVGDSSELEEMDPPAALLCELRPYQKQALHWMIQLEKGKCMDEAAMTLHPCWEAYHLADKRDRIIYLNAFSGDATTEFPSALQMARGGILADAMGLGKTIMTIALLVAHSGHGSSGSQPVSRSSSEDIEASDMSEYSSKLPKAVTKFSGFHKLMKQKKTLAYGGSLIVCPMTLLGQWKAEIESHVQPGSVSVYVHYGQSRPRDATLLAQSDVVITTYGVLASEFSTENSKDNGGLYSVSWFRVVLDEAHTIKSSKSQISIAAAALVAGRRWCLTGTPIQNNLEDIYSLLRFLRVEPWANWAWWNKLIQKPFEEGDERGLRLVQSILKTIMLRRTKFSTDREGRPILVLPPADIQVVYCELTEAEKDFYEALFKRSKVKFDQFVEQGRVLHNYASILELLLRLRQCCDHPFLVMSRGDTQEFSDLNKLARHFLKGSQNSVEGEAKDVPSRAYVQEVVEEMRKGEQGECPICLEAFEDAVLTTCAHRLCRECLLASWRNSTSGLCPVCRSNIPFLRLDGTLNQQQREKVLKQFSEDSDILVLLMSLKAGGVGINLTAASNAFVLDPWWNPAVEEQAVMRIHRIGQTKSVMIKRFIVKGTVEERMEAVQARKQRLISGALTDQEVRSARIEELKMLFT
ncbi:DNA repair protein RAD5A isoform X2 [Rosa chinensis]|uniref:DNA repair protein RAD5A isoform X2 n=1 Tax=Rosa chinensis TaxID=74649 RepID=UPI000D08CF9E|nr:DNA repair protein RAD5A isoform X2 [Rosa chinensis]